MQRRKSPGRSPLTTTQLPLRWVLVIPFVVQIFAIVSLTGWLSLRNGRQAVREVTEELRDEISDRIEQRLSDYLEVPQAINQFNASAIASGEIDPSDPSALTRRFWQQRELFTPANVSAIYLGGSQGDFIGLGFQSDNTWQVGRAAPETDNRFYSYATTATGEWGRLLERGRPYDPRIRPWYKAAIAADSPVWSDVYVDFKERRLKVTLAQPVSRRNQFLGVVGVDFVLVHIDNFLQELEVGKSGETFIIDHQGLLVAASVPHKLGDGSEADPERLAAVESDNPLIAALTRALATRYGDFARIETSQQLDLTVDGQRQFVQVVPFSVGRNLEWLIVVAIPEADFMAQIHANTRLTIAVCIAALLLAIAIGIMTSRWITRPVMRLSAATEAIASGELDQHVNRSRIRELRGLGDSFNGMADQLRASFAALAQANAELEDRVRRRTASLAEAEAKYRSIFENAIEGIFQSSPEDGYINANPALAHLYGYDSPAELIACLNRPAEQLYVEPTRRQEFMDAIDQQGAVYGFESQVYRRDRSIIWISENAHAVRDAEGHLLCYEGSVEDITRRKQAEEALRAEKQKSEQLLLNILPEPIVNQLKEDPGAIAQYFHDATILFADIVGFTPLSARLQPLELVNLLNDIFSQFDALAGTLQLEKIKTIGDAYMVAAGLPVPRSDHAEAIAEMALSMQAAVKAYRNAQGEAFQIRIGINTGAVVAGVIGTSKFIYDLWGDAVNLASRMESSGEPGRIQVSAATYERLRADYQFEPRGRVHVKGKGEMEAYWLLGQSLK
ncbi:MAG: PAS domain S-box protein [Spirulinaceae cyanobacterium RM2_2_10]|nr:PAS domain S-box protein [Spirulinaceae cyanobacterium SM2_1_0]NJO20015.1 PAS domain S-box protein [Spirulinaceae cyanobacterium RM2_2_10]